ncbi:MAG TPA: hypothetical protein VHJ78_01025 [Actinomycetota bacterium]|nr:hypothetical protein [Actinomycetota bacterium]
MADPTTEDIEMPEIPSAEEIPSDKPIDTSAAFSGTISPIKKDPEEMVQKRAEGKLPYQESETAMIGDNVTYTPNEPLPQTPPPGE